jgi:hypothetical protein
MSKTFDNIAEAASTNYLFLKAQMTISLAQEPPTPPPFYVLSFPSELVRAALWLVRKGPAIKKAVKVAVKSIRKIKSIPKPDEHQDEEHNSIKREPTRLVKALTRAGLLEASSDPGKDIEISRIARESESTLAETLRLATHITKYVIGNQAEVAQEERWRTSMQRKMDRNNRSFRELMMKAHRKSEANQDKMKANQEEMKANQEEMRTNQKLYLANQEVMKKNQEEYLANQKAMKRNQKENLENQEKMQENQTKIETKLQELHEALGRMIAV